jgi:hypothetical protein
VYHSQLSCIVIVAMRKLITHPFTESNSPRDCNRTGAKNLMMISLKIKIKMKNHRRHTVLVLSHWYVVDGWESERTAFH